MWLAWTAISNGGLTRLSSSLLKPSYSLSRDYTEFLEDLEEDPVLRQNVNVYKGELILLSSLSPMNTPFRLDEKKLQQNPTKITDDDDENIPQIDLNEMLADMTMEDSDQMDS